jgi:hypothetical protein
MNRDARHKAGHDDKWKREREGEGCLKIESKFRARGLAPRG